MKNDIMRGWKEVFRFTFIQNIKQKVFLLMTIIIAVVLFAGILGINVYLGYSSEKKEEKGKPDDIYFINDTELEIHPDISAHIETGMNKKQKPKENEIVIVLSEENEEFLLTARLSSDSKISEDTAQNILEQFVTVVEIAKCESKSLTDVQKQVMLSPVSSGMIKVGEKAESVVQKVMRILFPLMICIIMFVMIMIYGSSISKIMIAEKSSKLLETLLVSTKPYAIVAGKILAMTAIALCQFLVWILSLIAGYAVGNFINKKTAPSYQSDVHKILTMLQNGKDAFSVESIILALLAFGIGFFMYCVIAGVVSAGVKKAEELSGAMTLFQIPVFIGYFAVCLVPSSGNELAINITRYIPFSAAYRVSADVLIGNMTGIQAIISSGIMVLTSLLTIFVTGKVYKSKLF